MEKPPHIYVIGAGLIGLSTVDSLVRRGAQVSVLEKENGPAQGASFSNSGMIHPSQAWPWLEGDFYNEAMRVHALAQRSAKRLKVRMSELNLPDAKRTNGAIQLFDSIYIGQQARERYTALGVVCEDISGQAHTFGRYALHFPQDCSGDAFVYCKALEASLKDAGVVFDYAVNEAEVASVIRGNDPVVIAAGMGSVPLCHSIGVDIPVYPERGFALNFSRPDVALPDRPIMHHASRSALTVFKDHVRLSGTVGETAPEALLEIWEEIAPDVVAHLGEPINRWTGTRPMSGVGHPLIRHVKGNIWLNTGHGHMGWTLCAASGDLMAEMILDASSS